MALDANALATEMIANVTAAAAGGPVPTLDPILHALASAIVDHLKTNGVVLPTLLVSSPTGGPVTGTGTID